MLRRIGVSLVVAAMAVHGLATPAFAQSCLALQAELDTLQSRSSGGGNRARYERAFREQANVLARTEARARNAGCFGGGGFLFFRRDRDAACRVLLPKLRQMQVNLGRLDNLRRRAGDDGNAARIRQLKRALSRRICDEDRAETYNAGVPANPDIDPYSSNGTYRTLCVRTCDGYYFPISFSTTREQFGQDAQTCSAMCPGAESQLFYYPNPNGGPADMVSLTGASYTSMSTAFQYRTSLSPSCSCKPAGGFSPIPANPTSSDGTQAQADTGPLLPRPRPEPGEDPETLANRLGDLRPGSSALASAGEGRMTTSGGRSVRVVGDAYWGVPKEDGVVISPVPN